MKCWERCVGVWRGDKGVWKSFGEGVGKYVGVWGEVWESKVKC